MHLLRDKLRSWAGPRWPRPVRLSLALLLTLLGFVCYRWRLTTARGFMTIGSVIILLVLAVKIIWWRTRGTEQA